MNVFPERLKQLRVKQGKNQADIAEIIGASVQSYSAYEAGREPKYDMLCQLCDYFGVSADYMLGRTDAPTPAVANMVEELGISPNAIMNLIVNKRTKTDDMQFKALSYLINVAWDSGFFINLFYYLFATFQFEGDNPETCNVHYEEDAEQAPMELSHLNLNDIYFGKVLNNLIDLKNYADNCRETKGNVRGWE